MQPAVAQHQRFRLVANGGSRCSSATNVSPSNIISRHACVNEQPALWCFQWSDMRLVNLQAWSHTPAPLLCAAVDSRVLVSPAITSAAVLLRHCFDDSDWVDAMRALTHHSPYSMDLFCRDYAAIGHLMSVCEFDAPHGDSVSTAHCLTLGFCFVHQFDVRALGSRLCCAMEPPPCYCYHSAAIDSGVPSVYALCSSLHNTVTTSVSSLAHNGDHMGRFEHLDSVFYFPDTIGSFDDYGICCSICDDIVSLSLVLSVAIGDHIHATNCGIPHCLTRVLVARPPQCALFDGLSSRNSISRCKPRGGELCECESHLASTWVVMFEYSGPTYLMVARTSTFDTSPMFDFGTCSLRWSSSGKVCAIGTVVNSKQYLLDICTSALSFDLGIVDGSKPASAIPQLAFAAASRSAPVAAQQLASAAASRSALVATQRLAFAAASRSALVTAQQSAMMAAASSSAFAAAQQSARTTAVSKFVFTTLFNSVFLCAAVCSHSSFQHSRLCDLCSLNWSVGPARGSLHNELCAVGTMTLSSNCLQRAVSKRLQFNASGASIGSIGDS